MTSAEDLLKLAKQLNVKQDYKGVIQLLSDYDLKIHNSAQLYLERADANLALMEYEPMNTDADKALMIEPESERGLCYKGIYCRTVQDYRNAILFLKRAIQIDPKYALAYNSLGVVYYYTTDTAKAIECHDKAIEIAPHYANAYENLFIVYQNLQDWSKALEYYQRTVRIAPKSKYTNFYLGRVYDELKEYKKAIEYYENATTIDSKYAEAYNGIGNVYGSLKEHDKAIDYYNEALKGEPTFKYAFYNLIRICRKAKRFNDSIAYYKNGIKEFPEYTDAINELGNVYVDLKKYEKIDDKYIEKAIEWYKRAIDVDPKYFYSYFNLGECYFNLKSYDEALKAYNSFVERSDKNVTFYKSIAKFNIGRLKKINDGNDVPDKEYKYKTVYELVKKVKDLLEFKKPCVTHYTSLSTANALILDTSMFRLSEGAFLNDTSEGRQLFDYLEFPEIVQKGMDIIAQPFSRKPFIGSFVPEDKDDNLTLWRMYGKQEKDEAKGCAITLAREGLLESLSDKLMSNSSLNSSASERPSNPVGELEFYNVAYRLKEKNEFIVPGSEESESALNVCMKALLSEVTKFKNKKFDTPRKEEIETQNLMELLNEISFLFKSAEYQHEHEVRLIINGTGFKKEINKTSLPLNPPRVYIELVSIRPLIQKITLGPKIDRSDEWAASFYYNLHADNYHPRILISRQPFK